MKLVDNGLGRNTDSGDEEAGAALDDDIDEFVELSLCVIVANRGVSLATYIERHRWRHKRLTLSCARFHRLEEGEGRHRRGRSCPSDSS